MARRLAAVAATFLALATLSACGDGDSSLATGDPDATATSSEGSTDAHPRTHVMTVFSRHGAEVPDARVEMPHGFTDDDSSWYVVSDDRGEFLGLMTVEQVDADACLDATKDSVDAGVTARDLTDVLVDQTSTRASRPRRVALAGHHGWYVELRGPADLSRCDRYPALWRKPGERGIYGDRQVDRLWVLDVAGTRVVVDAAYSEGRSSHRDVARLEAMIDSLEFV